MSRPIAIRISLAAALLTGLAGSAHADQIYIEGTNDTLATLDPTTGAIGVIGNTSGVLMGGLGFAADGTLYGLDFSMNLYSVNTTTGAATLLGFTGTAYGGGGFALGNTFDGTLYLQNTGNLYAVDPTTHHATLLGPLGFNTTADDNGDASNNLYIINNANNGLYSVNRTNGGTTLIGTGTVPGQIFGVAFANGVMYEIQASGTGIYSVSLADGHSTFVSNFSTAQIGNIYTAATLFSPVNVPEPGSLALLGIGAAGLLARLARRRRRAGAA